jgi:hypothetical protein
MIAQGNANIFLYVALSVRQNQYVNKNESSLMEYRKHNNIFDNQSIIYFGGLVRFYYGICIRDILLDNYCFSDILAL